MIVRKSWILPPLASLLTCLGMGEICFRLGWINPAVLAPPSRIFLCLWLERVSLGGAMFVTAKSTLLGFFFSASLGLGLGILLSQSHFLFRAFYPYAVFFQTVPVVAIAPLLIIWFGYGMPAVVASSFIVSVFPMIASTLAGLRAADPALKELFRLYGASKTACLLKLDLPFAIPHLMSGLRMVGGLAVIGAIVGEFLGGIGLGSVIDVARTQQRMDILFAAVLLTSFLGLLMVSGVDLLQRLLLRTFFPHASRSSAKGRQGEAGRR